MCKSKDRHRLNILDVIAVLVVMGLSILNTLDLKHTVDIRFDMLENTRNEDS